MLLYRNQNRERANDQGRGADHVRPVTFSSFGSAARLERAGGVGAGGQRRHRQFFFSTQKKSNHNS